MARILDCTLRDGGYVNKWGFSEDFFEGYLRILAESTVELVELGFRSKNNPLNSGPFASTPAQFITRAKSRLGKGASSKKVGVMVNAKDVLEAHESGADWMQTLEILGNQSETPDFVRFASNVSEIPKLVEILSAADNVKNFPELMLNIMKAHSFEPDEVDFDTLRQRFSTIYLADSFGSLTPDLVERKFTQLKQVWSGHLGFHGHDNLGLALENSLSAFAGGADIVDGTVGGIGRGAGNTKTEDLLFELDASPESVTPIVHFVDTHLNAIRSKHPWGGNFFYRYSARLGIHPTFVQTMLEDSRYSSLDLLSSLKVLGEMEKRGSYSDEILNEIQSEELPAIRTARPHAPLSLESKMIIFGSGTTLQSQPTLANWLLGSKNSTKAQLNICSFLNQALIDITFVLSPLRARLEKEKLEDQQTLVIAPTSALSTIGIDLRKATHEVGVTILSERAPEPLEGTLGLWANRALLYALQIAQENGVREILLAGVDGILDNGEPDLILLEAFEKTTSLSNVDVISATATNLPVRTVNAFETPFL